MVIPDSDWTKGLRRIQERGVFDIDQLKYIWYIWMFKMGPWEGGGKVGVVFQPLTLYFF